MTGASRNRAPVSASVALVVGLLGAACAPDRPQDAKTFPPVILISIDTLRADRLPAYGYGAVDTPAIDRLRQDSILFGNAYTSAPLTLPAHSSLMTGLPPNEHGVRDNLGYQLDADRHTTLAERLQRSGYATGAAVSSYVLRSDTGIDAGFDWYDDLIEVTAQTIGELQRAGPATVRRALDWLATPEGKPLFLFLHLFEPHSPYSPPEPFASRYASPYDGEVAAADAAVDMLLSGLRSRGLYEDALIVLLSDHGEGLGDHGEAEHGVLLHRETIRVPLLMKLPGGLRGGESVSSPVQLLDVTPTVLDVLGLDGGNELPGRSLLGEHEGRLLYSETYHGRLHFGWSELRSLVDGDLHFIDGTIPELYDLASDPDETRNVLDQRRADARRLRAAVEAIDPAFLPPVASDPREMERLRSLGYLAAPIVASGTLPDPKAGLPLLREVRTALGAAARDDHATAIAALGAILSDNPEMLDVRFQLAKSLTAVGRLEDALGLYREALEQPSIAIPAVLVETARILLTLGRVDEAEAHAEGALDHLPVEAHQLFAQIAIERGDLDAALRESQSAVAAEDLPRAESLLLQGRIHLARDELTQALLVLDQVALRIAEGALAPVRGLQAERGEALGRLNRLAEAEAALQAEIQAFPDHALAYRRLAFVYGAMRRFDEIDPVIEAMVRASPTRTTRLLAADTVRRLGDEEGARTWETKAGGS